MRFPRLKIDLEKLRDNAVRLLSACREEGITSCMVVTKVLAGNFPAARLLAGMGFSHLADSRIENLIRYQNLPLPKVLLRLPMISEADRVVRYADVSLNSEPATLNALETAAARQGKTHGIILMFDLGDLREGLFFQDEYLSVVEKLLGMTHLRLDGIGTNLTCYGGILPEEKNLGTLLDIRDRIESAFSIRLPLISGGNSSTLYLIEGHRIPVGINSLRIGEALFLGRETAFGNPIPGMNQDVFTLEAELIECREKPSFPIGNMGMNSFGDRPQIEDRGLMRRGILALGRQDAEASDLVPLDPGIRIVGASSDHLLVDLGTVPAKVGDVLRFRVDYPGLLRLMTSAYVRKVCIGKSADQGGTHGRSPHHP